jgi:hypothetical protein
LTFFFKLRKTLEIIKWLIFSFHLFAESVIRCRKSVALAIDGRGSAPPDGIHFPVGVVIVDHMEVAVPTSA